MYREATDMWQRETSELNFYATLEITSNDAETAACDNSGLDYDVSCDSGRTDGTAEENQTVPTGFTTLGSAHFTTFNNSWFFFHTVTINLQQCKHVMRRRRKNCSDNYGTSDSFRHGVWKPRVVNCEEVLCRLVCFWGERGSIACCLGLNFVLRRPWAMITINYLNFRKKCEVEENTVIIL
jgi:hypothetical protein